MTLKAVATESLSASGITIGTSVITGGTDTRVLFDDGGVVGENAAFTFNKTNGAVLINGALTVISALRLGGATVSDLFSGVAGEFRFRDGTTTTNLSWITVPAPNTWQWGEQDAAAAVAQTIRVQSVVAGTSNIAGANFTIAGSRGTGAGAGGSILLQGAYPATTGSAQNANVTVLTLSTAVVNIPVMSLGGAGGSERAVFNFGTASTMRDGGNGILDFNTSGGGSGLARIDGGNQRFIIFNSSGNNSFVFARASVGSLTFGSTVPVGWSASTDGTAAQDTVINRIGVGIFRLDNLIYSNSATQILGSKTTITGGATGNVPTLTAGPVTGNPTKWLPYDDNGTTRYIPSW